MSEMVAWRCPRGHVLGQVRRNGSKRQRLLLYRLAVDLSPIPSPKGEGSLEEVDVMAVVEGLVLDVRCSICGGIRTWRPGLKSGASKNEAGATKNEAGATKREEREEL